MATQVMTQTLYADLPELLDRVRMETLLACLDFNRDGQIDTGPLDRIRIPASADIDAALATAAGVYPSGFTAPFPPKLVEIALDGMVYRLGMTYPTVVVVDYNTLMKKVQNDLQMIRKGQLSLGQTPPEPNRVHGGYITPPPNNSGGRIFKRGGWGGVF